ncbi:beta-galactosidase [Hymenobacter sp. GOD-10R]|uniref:beta-galactosidase n=1 Tax=Hymenobacter sp. GOD-10R TaxID=3093922 RepID=UPI002D7910EE|nr:beta-galactosidase [Hymenobacter sp. GOD-10R]WRQ28373.1 beta-galactosidase [Hymenobacter sp. GOD-10R]
MAKYTLLLLLLFSQFQRVSAQAVKPRVNKLLYGVAYYDEYMPYDRLDKDIQMMKAAGINLVRIAESTWSTVEPQEGVFDFSHIDRVLNAMHKAGISVIIGTPTYAVPTWLVRKYPAVLAITPQGQNQYGPRQNMDISNPDYRRHAELVIRAMLGHVKNHPAIIGYQIDNETKAYNTAGPAVQKQFVQYMQKKFPSLDALNKAYGLDYWSNRINSWEDFPSTVGTINASLGSEFAKFQRQLVTDFLAWQAAMVREYKKPEQFITQNFDLDWRGHSYGIQSEVDHFAAAKALDIAGIDIYHPSQDQLTGTEISLGGDITRSMKGGQSYLVLETEAQGFPQWVPYPGQLRLQAFSHLASGASLLEYWHWHSIHNSAETYWKGLLSHDFEPNPVYNEAKTIGQDFNRLSTSLVNLQKTNKVAILFSNEALTAEKWFANGLGYNEVLRSFYDALYRQNVGCDFVDPSSPDLDKYSLVIVPMLYAAPTSLLERLNQYVQKGGHLVCTYRSGFSDENVKVRTTPQPGVLSAACGVTYSLFTAPDKVTLKGDPYQVGQANNQVSTWMELLTPTTAKVLASYDHPAWGKYAAITENTYGKGLATYIGCRTSNAVVEKIVADAVKKDGLWGADQELQFPLITKAGVNQRKKMVHYYFNYSAAPSSVRYPHGAGKELLSSQAVAKNQQLQLGPWGVQIVEEQ